MKYSVWLKFLFFPFILVSLESCKSFETKKQKNIEINGLSVCNELKDGTCEFKWFLRVRLAKEFYGCADISKTDPEISIQFTLKKKVNRETILESPMYSATNSKICHKFVLQDMPKLGETYFLDLSGHNGRMNGHSGATFEISSLAELERVKICLHLDGHHCEHGRDGIPVSTKEFYVTLIHKQEVPSEQVLIEVVDKFDLKDSGTPPLLTGGPIKIESKEITQKIIVDKPLKKGRHFLKFVYSEIGDTEGAVHREFRPKDFHVE